MLDGDLRPRGRMRRVLSIVVEEETYNSKYDDDSKGTN